MTRKPTTPLNGTKAPCPWDPASCQGARNIGKEGADINAGHGMGSLRRASGEFQNRLTTDLQIRYRNAWTKTC